MLRTNNLSQVWTENTVNVTWLSIFEFYTVKHRLLSLPLVSNVLGLTKMILFYTKMTENQSPSSVLLLFVASVTCQEKLTIVIPVYFLHLCLRLLLKWTHHIQDTISAKHRGLPNFCTLHLFAFHSIIVPLSILKLLNT